MVSVGWGGSSSTLNKINMKFIDVSNPILNAVIDSRLYATVGISFFNIKER